MAKKSLPEIIAVKESIEERLLKQPGVTGVDVGYKYVNGHRTDEIAIRVMVEKKKKTVPEAERVPAAIDDAVTDVIERTYFLHDAMKNRKKVDDISLQADTGSYSPVKGGISIGPCRVVGGFVYVGTLGAIVKDNTSSNPMLLSNFHVMCIDNGWHVGDTMAQPGRVDGGSCPASVVGTLQRAALTSAVDCAVSSLSGRGYSCEIVDIGKVAGTGTAALGMPVRKRGRTTGLTYGFVDSVSLSVNIDYGNGIGNRMLTNQIDIRPDTAHNAAFGDHGDSGSAVVDNSIKVVGLHFAGSSDGHGIANPIAAVLSALNVSMCVGTKASLKDFKDHKEPLKDHKELVKEHKEFLKEQHKEFVKETIKDHKPEKVELEGPQKTVFDTPPGKIQVETGPLQPGAPVQTGPSAAPAKTPVKETGKEFSKSEIKDIKEKNEAKDHKDHIKEWKEKNEIKDQKPESKESKDHKEGKDNKEHKDQKDHKDHKPEFKEHKPEFKEYKLELKEHLKPEVKEIEKPQFEVPNKGWVETGPFQPPFDPAQPGAGGLEQRLAQLEAAVGQLSIFITSDLRPDLSAGALTNEPGNTNQGSGSGGC
jgi:hypothetical protein